MDEKMQDALNSQLNAELYSAYLYLSMEAYFDSKDLKGFANWMRVQVQEELAHATKFYDYIAQRGGKVTLTQINAPPHDWDSILAVFEHVYEHEKMVTDLINQLVNLAVALSDHATNNFLQWYVAEQVEEEESSSGVLQKIKLMGDAPGGMFMLDSELAKRVFTPPTQTK
ncbi:ferritin [Methanobacterium paludis]|uniref:Ferroxidase n=1 Tax=Methanobacterium paludis (strain DSM 25820 / JCM 18151 / SWAN1) TaxID=868131 RepID=F6D5R9_METPW|nr:ferritin [Methanobacterium paludis]AEG18251.1 Ferroxidase [Methanobacterium paludis]